MGGAKGVVLAFGPAGEAGEATALAQRADPVAPPGQYLMRIGLVTDVPNQFVIGGIEDVMQGNRQLDHAETGSKMAARNCNRVDGLGAQFVGNLLQVPRINAAQIGRALDQVEKVGAGFCDEVIVGRRHAVNTFPTNLEALVLLAKPLRSFFVAQFELCRLCHEVSQSASIYDAWKSSTRKALIILDPSASGGDFEGDFPVAGRQHLAC